MKSNLAKQLKGTHSDPFGMLLVGRNWEGGSEYRFGFNTQEQDDEVYGNGNLNTAEFWEYDTRLGRRWNVDPVVKEWESPYATFSNNPTYLIDPSGSDTLTFLNTTVMTDAKSSGLDNYPSQPAILTNSSIDIKVSDSPDVFYYNTKFIHYDIEGNLIGEYSTSTQFDPVNNKVSGLTSTCSFLGLVCVQDRSQVTLGKLAPDEVLNYLINKSSYKF
ncbi:MAG: hypothetical protein V9F05_06260 [Chitinophagaceae bacterium]